MLKLTEYTKSCKELKEDVKLGLKIAGYDAQFDELDTEKIRLVFAGQYSAGKSSILKMLTGREDIAIGATITTQKPHSYDWNGIEVVDTPGIHTDLRPDHDEISYNAIASADLLVFVVTNELFDSYIASHFRKLAIDKDKAGEMILVVNKMDRSDAGNTEEQQRVIREDLKKLLEPYTPEQLHLSFLDAESYLDSLEERKENPDIADELLNRSGYRQFIETLNRFVSEKSLSAKITTELYIMDDTLDKAIKEIQPKSSDVDIDALEENFMQQKHVCVETKRRLQQEVRDIFFTTSNKIRTMGAEAAECLSDSCEQVEVESKLKSFLNDTENLISQCEFNARETIERRLKEVGEELDNIENSEFTCNLKIRLSERYESLPGNIKQILTGAGKVLREGGAQTLNGAYKTGVNGGLKLTNFSGSTIHEVVKNVGHFVGFKFRPWQAIKITRGIAAGAQILGALGVGLSVFMQIKEDQEDERNREELRKSRQNIVSQFNLEANNLEDFARHFIEENVIIPLGSLIDNIDDNIEKIRNTRMERNEACQKLEDLQKQCRTLIQDIHSNDVL